MVGGQPRASTRMPRGSLPTPNRPHLNGICPYYTMFPLRFPLRQLRGAAQNALVLDPFCGRGTTNLAARLLGIPSVGLDSNPVAVAIAKAKLSSADPSAVVEECQTILAEAPDVEKPEGEFWELCYHDDTLRSIVQVRAALLEHCRSDVRVSLRGLLLGLLHGPLRETLPSYLSNQMPRTYATKPEGAVRYWRARGMRPPRVDLLDLVRRRARLYLGHSFPDVAGSVAVHDARQRFPADLPTGFTRVVTSPPYIGMDLYSRDQWLRNWFVGGPEKPGWDPAGSISTEDPERFVAELSAVWSNVARACAPGARMVIRFGSIPKSKVRPAAVIAASLDASEAPWRVLTVSEAGLPENGRRQAEQFLKKPAAASHEVDIHAVLGAN